MSEEKLPRPEDLAFGDALEELEAIVTALEGGDLDLEESMSRYERGVALLRSLQAKLADAQQKVTMLIGELEADEDTSEELVELGPEGAPEE